VAEVEAVVEDGEVSDEAVEAGPQRAGVRTK
jgi:hypothetical protein